MQQVQLNSLKRVIVHAIFEKIRRFLISKVAIDCEMDLAGVATGHTITSLDLGIENLEFGVTGILDDDGISKQISDVINKNTIKLFHKYSKNISQLIMTVLNKVIDVIVNKNFTSSINEGADIIYKSGDSWSLWEALHDMFASLL
ncbi:unnamed protein product [Callosobruchus maculatus]|uniref:Uncharacterized protein n=1 Tax=Callosobruchus maculatus TaxID=64391 RepID=A0A653CYY4_CALMS|nr:unnamed protein product [Callosobruchus maculatus]